MYGEETRNRGQRYCNDFALEVARGNISSVTHINKFGSNTNVASGATEEIWTGSTPYVFPATALMTSISQTTDQVAMRGGTIEVEGLDANWAMVVQNATLDASDTTTVVTLDTALIRCFRMQVLEDVVITSSIRVHNAGETQDYAKISTGDNGTLMAIYTVPMGVTAYMINWYADQGSLSASAPESNAIRLWSSDRAGPYAARVRSVFGLPPDGGKQRFFIPYKVFTEKTDIYVTSAPVAQPAAVSAGFDLCLVDN